MISDGCSMFRRAGSRSRSMMFCGKLTPAIPPQTGAAVGTCFINTQAYRFAAHPKERGGKPRCVGKRMDGKPDVA